MAAGLWPHQALSAPHRFTIDTSRSSEIFTVLSPPTGCRLEYCIFMLYRCKQTVCKVWRNWERAQDQHQHAVRDASLREEGETHAVIYVFAFLSVFVWYEGRLTQRDSRWRAALFTPELNHTQPSWHKLFSSMFCFLVNSYIYRQTCERTVGHKAAKSVAAGALSVETCCSVNAQVGCWNVVGLKE